MNFDQAVTLVGFAVWPVVAVVSFTYGWVKSSEFWREEMRLMREAQERKEEADGPV